MYHYEGVKMNNLHLHTSVWMNLVKIINERSKLQNNALQLYQGKNYCIVRLHNTNRVKL